MRKLLFMLFGCLLFLEGKVSVLDYATLKDSVYTDHVIPFEELFKHYRPKNIVELGLGFGTINLIRNSDKVLSIELIVPEYGEEWLAECIECFSPYTNWGSEAIDIQNFKDLLQANSETRHSFHLTWTDAFVGDYLQGKVSEPFYNPNLDLGFVSQLSILTGEILEKSKAFLKEDVEVLFVDSGFLLRGDLVNSFFGKVPIIVAHDTNSKGEYSHFHLGYGYHRVKVPTDYVEIHYPKGVGTTFYMHTDYADLIDHMQTFILTLNE